MQNAQLLARYVVPKLTKEGVVTRDVNPGDSLSQGRDKKIGKQGYTAVHMFT